MIYKNELYTLNVKAICFEIYRDDVYNTDNAHCKHSA